MIDKEYDTHLEAPALDICIKPMEHLSYLGWFGYWLPKKTDR